MRLYAGKVDLNCAKQRSILQMMQITPYWYRIDEKTIHYGIFIVFAIHHFYITLNDDVFFKEIW
jgi:hypothetical protein